MAARSGRPMGTADLLLALLLVECRATPLLRDRRLTVEQLTPFAPSVLSEPEPPQMLVEVEERARQMALGVAAPEVDSLHLIMVLSRISGSAAYRLLTRAGQDPAQLRNLALAYATGRLGARRDPTGSTERPAAPQVV